MGRPRPRPRRRRQQVAALVLLAAAALGACGSDDDAADPTTSSPSTSTAVASTTTEPTVRVSEPDLPPRDGFGDPALDALAQQCFDGDYEACDDLYFDAPFESEAGQYGSSCAGRTEPAFFPCESRIGAAPLTDP
jgi:hypothetical protein